MGEVRSRVTVWGIRTAPDRRGDVDVQIQGSATVAAFLDTGTSTTIVSRKVARKAGIDVLPVGETEVRVASDEVVLVPKRRR